MEAIVMKRWHLHKYSVLTMNRLSCFRRLLSTASSGSYPYSANAVLLPPPVPQPTASLLKGKGLMAQLNKTLPSEEKQTLLATLFSRRHPKRLLPGSVITVTLTHAPTTFTGVLLGIRRRGPATSFVLRNVIQRTGVEMQFFANSPHLKDIQVVQRAGGGGGKEGKRMRRAKLFYLRDSPEKMSQISAGMRG
jgi:large subunit ribosomal protein L19